MKETVITWTVTNWITVFLMVFLMTVLIGFATKTFIGMKGKGDNG